MPPAFDLVEVLICWVLFWDGQRVIPHSQGQVVPCLDQRSLLWTLQNRSTGGGWVDSPPEDSSTFICPESDLGTQDLENQIRTVHPAVLTGHKVPSNLQNGPVPWQGHPLKGELP